MAHSHPYLYLNPNALREAGLEAEAVERFLAEQIRQEDGIAHAITRADLLI